MAMKTGVCTPGPFYVNNTATGNSTVANGAFGIVQGDSENPTILFKFLGQVNNAAANVPTVQNTPMAQPTLFTIPDPGVANANFVLQPFALVGNQTKYVDITVPVASLASAGKVNIQVASSGTAQYVIRSVCLRYSTAGLSGNSGDRLLSLTDGTIVWTGSGITAALLGTPINTIWGGTGLPLPSSTDMSVHSTAGANLFLQYTGGTADFNAGSISLSVELQQVTA